MKNWIIAVILVVSLLTIGIFIGQSCKDDVDLTTIEKAITESKETVKQIQKDIEAINDSISALAEQRLLQKNYYNYEITKIDSIYALPDSTMVNPIIRAWTDRIYRLPDFFKVTTSDIGTPTGR
jgi:hypothetical protein